MNDQTTAAVELPKDVTQDQYNAAEAAIINGFDEGKPHADIKGELFEAGVKYKAVAKVFKMVTTAHDLIRDPEDVTKEISAKLEDLDLSFEDHDQLVRAVADITDSVKGSNDRKVLAMIKTRAEEAEIELPKKKTGSGPRVLGTGKVHTAIKEAFIADPKISLAALITALLPHVKDEKNATYHAKQYYGLCSALAAAWA